MMTRGWLAVAVLCALACEEAHAPDTPAEEVRVTGADLPPTRIPPCFSTPLADGGSPEEHLAGVSLPASDVQGCVEESKVEGEFASGSTTFVVSVGTDARVSSIEVQESCGVPAHSVLCFAQAFGHARVEPRAAAKHGTVTLSFGEGRIDARSATSTVGYTTMRDFTLRATDAFKRKRPAFDACAKAASARAKFDSTWAQFTLALEPDGKVREIQVDPFVGDQTLLACAAEALQSMQFPPPPRGSEIVREHLAFEPPP